MYIATYFTSFFVISLYEGIYLYQQNKEAILKSEKLKREHINSELQGLRNRFRNNLNVSIEVADNYLDQYVVPMSLQLLFENVIKHNILSAKKPLTIKVFVDANNNIVVQNNIQVKKQTLPSTGVGLENISSRISYFTEKKLEVLEDDQYFRVGMPLVDRYNKEA